MRNSDESNEKSVFVSGLLVGAVAGGLVVSLLDKEERKNLFDNLKTDWKSILRQVSEVLGEEKSSKAEKPVIGNLQTVENHQESEVPLKPQKMFFRKQGKKLK